LPRAEEQPVVQCGSRGSEFGPELECGDVKGTRFNLQHKHYLFSLKCSI
jgi:hypothetical protein